MDIFKTTVASIVTVRDVTVVIEKRACRCSSALSGQLQPTECPPPVRSAALCRAAGFRACLAAVSRRF